MYFLRIKETLRCMVSSKSFIPHCVVSHFASSTIINNGQDEKKDPFGNNPFYDKYSKKIAEIDKSQPKDSLARLNALRERQKPQVPSPSTELKSVPSFTRQQGTLSDVIDVQLFTDKTSEEISNIWIKHHHSLKECISGDISSKAFHLIQERSALYPTFLLPLPRNQGYEYIVSQFSGLEVHFTPLVSYQTYKENSPECLSIRHFIELNQEKGIVLFKGEFNSDIINNSEAVCLINQLQRYYAEHDSQRTKLLQCFNDSPKDFQHIDLIVELERLAS